MSFSLIETNISLVFDILVQINYPNKYDPRSKPLILDIFKLLGSVKPSVLLQTEKTKNISLIHNIRHLLVSRDPNDVYIFIRCLEVVDPSLWAGTIVDHPAALDGLEFERIMQLMDSADQAISRRVRLLFLNFLLTDLGYKQTLRIINRVDPTILEARLDILMKSNPASTERRGFINSVLEVAAVRYANDGDGYARRVIDLIRHLDTGDTSAQVIKELIDVALTHIRSCCKQSSLHVARL